MSIRIFTSAVMCLFLGTSVCAVASEPYCGLYSVHAALHAIGKDIEFDPLVCPENLSGRPGSTAADLIDILKQNNCDPIYRISMRASELSYLRCPAILHTKPAMVRAKPRHWVAFLGFRGSRVVIYDPPSGIQEMQIAELMTQWDGTAILVNSNSPYSWWPDTWVSFGLIVSGTMVVLLPRLPIFRAHSMVTIVTGSVVAAALWHSCSEYGFLSNEYAVTNILAHGDESHTHLSTVDSAELDHLLLSDKVIVVDARKPEDYRFSHIEGAINVPISSSQGDLKHVLAKIPRSNKIVFYCQSTSCSWAEKVAKMFSYHGFDDISIYSEGMLGWQDHMRKKDHELDKKYVQGDNGF